jgi:hypothetical protein
VDQFDILVMQSMRDFGAERGSDSDIVENLLNENRRDLFARERLRQAEEQLRTSLEEIARLREQLQGLGQNRLADDLIATRRREAYRRWSKTMDDIGSQRRERADGSLRFHLENYRYNEREAFSPRIEPFETKGTSIPRGKHEREAVLIGNPDLGGDRKFCWPDLPHAEKEVRDAATNWPGSSSVMVRSEASHSAVTSALAANQRTLRFIHFATHGVSDAENPADASFLALRSRNLLAAEVKKYKLHANPLVVLSACETGLGKAFRGGIFGMAYAWYAAGAKQVVVSLWNVDDHGTNQLMERFMTALREFKAETRERIFGDGAEFALTRAMTELKKENKDPAIWAGFTVYGRPTRD